LSRKKHLLGGDNERPCAVPQVRSEVSPARSERSGQTFPLARRDGKMGTRGRSGNRFSLRSTQCRANDRCNRANHPKICRTLLRAALSLRVDSPRGWERAGGARTSGLVSSGRTLVCTENLSSGVVVVKSAKD